MLLAVRSFVVRFGSDAVIAPPGGRRFSAPAREQFKTMTMQRVYVSGKVQRSGYRDWAVRRAQELGITGWVRNMSDGRVELLLVGDDHAVMAMIEACRQGSDHSRVEQVESHPVEERAPKGFTKRFTA